MAHAANVKPITTQRQLLRPALLLLGPGKTDNPFYVDRIRQEMDRDLQAKGWHEVPQGGDVTIFATGNVQNQQELESTYSGFGGGWGGGWGWRRWGWGPAAGFGETTTTTVNQPVGHLVLDVSPARASSCYSAVSPPQT